MNYGAPASLYRAALLLGLVRGAAVIRWADEVIGTDPAPPPAFFEIASTQPDDLTGLRARLLELCEAKESPEIVRALIGLVHRDLASGRRGFGDTMTVLKQLRAFVAVDRDLNERLKAFGVDLALAPAGSRERTEAEQRVIDWLRQHDGGVDA